MTDQFQCEVQPIIIFVNARVNAADKANMRNYPMFVGGIAKVLLKNPFAVETRMDWSVALMWLRRPSTVILFFSWFERIAFKV